LVAKEIGFIVGARLANLPINLINRIHSQLDKQDENLVEFTYHDQRLICKYSEKRATKDRADRNRQIEKAKTIIDSPTSITGRYRFLKKDKDLKYLINTELIGKAEKLEGIKGYITNTNLDTQTIIDRYHDLW